MPPHLHAFLACWSVNALFLLLPRSHHLCLAASVSCMPLPRYTLSSACSLSVAHHLCRILFTIDNNRADPFAFVCVSLWFSLPHTALRLFSLSLFRLSLPSVSRPLPQLRFSESRLYTYSLSPSLDDDSGPPFALAFANMRAHAHLLAVSDEDGFVSFIRTDIDTELCADEAVKQSDDLMDSDWEPRNGVKERESLYMCI